MEAWSEGETLHLGAEAEVIAGTWFGRPAVLKNADHVDGDIPI